MLVHDYERVDFVWVVQWSVGVVVFDSMWNNIDSEEGVRGWLEAGDWSA